MVSNKVKSTHRKNFFFDCRSDISWKFWFKHMHLYGIENWLQNGATVKIFSHTMITDFWFRWSNVKLILSWDSRIIPNKNSQIRIDYFLNHTFKRNCLSEFREQIYEEYNRLIQRRRNLIHPLMFKNIGNY